MKKAQPTQKVSSFDLSIEPKRVPTGQARSNDAAAGKARVVVITQL